MNRKKLSVYDYLRLKGKRQLSVIAVHNVDEARAAEEANIDMICASHDAPQHGIYTSFEELKKIREAAPNCFMQSGSPYSAASEYEAIKQSNKYLSIGVDCIYGGNWSNKWIKSLKDANIPINSHVGLVPGKASWIGGYRAIGKTAEEAKNILVNTLKIQDAGAISVELEVVPIKIASIITKKVDIITISMGSGSGCDGQYLYGNDILGYTQERIPRHARKYLDFKSKYIDLQKQRVSAFKEFNNDTINKNFNDSSIAVDMENSEYEKFLEIIEKI